MITHEHLTEGIKSKELVEEAIECCSGHNPIIVVSGALYLIKCLEKENSQLINDRTYLAKEMAEAIGRCDQLRRELENWKTTAILKNKES